LRYEANVAIEVRGCEANKRRFLRNELTYGPKMSLELWLAVMGPEFGRESASGDILFVSSLAGWRAALGDVGPEAPDSKGNPGVRKI
jgi:hypothetical protein